MLLVQQVLRHYSLAFLEEKHGVKARVEGHKLSLNYDQIEAREDDKLAQQCRGLILRVADHYQLPIDPQHPIGDTVVLARPFDRFFNYGQGAAAKVDFDHPDTVFYEKMDGTLCIVYFDDFMHEWHVATRSVPEANLPMDGFGEYTFRTLFEKALEETTGLNFATWTAERLSKGMTYMFELTTPLNRIVVDYPCYGVTLLGARDTLTGREYDPALIEPNLGTSPCPRYRFSSVSELVDFVSSREPTKHEGVVVCDHLYRRVKIKNVGYLALNKVRDSVMNSPRGLVELILLEKLDDALPLFPEYIQERALALRDSFADLLRAYRDTYETVSARVAEWNEKQGWIHEKGSKEHRKAFAIAAQASEGWMAPMMDQYQGRCDSLMGWILNKRGVDGGWSNGFLDTILGQIEAQP